MPRTSRASKGGFIYHVLNRGNARGDVFHKPDDFAAFVRLMREAHDRLPMAGWPCLWSTRSRTCATVCLQTVLNREETLIPSIDCPKLTAAKGGVFSRSARLASKPWHTSHLPSIRGKLGR